MSASSTVVKTVGGLRLVVGSVKGIPGDGVYRWTVVLGTLNSSDAVRMEEPFCAASFAAASCSGL